MRRVRCGWCKTMFFYDNTDEKTGKIIDEKITCPFCMDDLTICLVCNKRFLPKVISQKYNLDIKIRELCEECKKIFGGFADIWQILRFKTFEKDNFRCVYCGRSPLTHQEVVLHCDHIIPRSQGGENKLSNLTTSCEDCNQGKLDTMLEKHIEFISQRKDYNDRSKTDIK